MKKELREKILAYNRRVKAQGEKSADLEALTAALLKLPAGQLKKVLSGEVIAVLKKYGYEEA